MITKLNIIVDAIFSTGKGESIENAFHVIDVREEYALINLTGLVFGGEQSLVEENGHFYDQLSLKENEYGMSNIYFDVCQPYNSLSLD